MNKLNFTLPEFCFLDGNSHLGNTLEGRTVIQHIRSYTVIEAIALEDVKELHLNCQTFEFDYKNRFGTSEKHIFALHFTMDEKENIPEVFEKCRKWYCDYMTWEDSNIMEDSQSKLN
ncbi:MAG: hypothetical protein HC905_09425 [Bacteroidales bacterium]|nr:hypothetical protein [Bacteroidales bacterium]